MHAGMSYARLEELGGIPWPCWDETQPGEQFLHARLWEDEVKVRAPFNAVLHDPPVDVLDDDFPLRLTTGRRLSEWQDAHRFRDAPYDALVIGLARPGAELAGRIEARARAMVAGGFLEEVRTLRARVSLDAPAFRAVGYREMLDCVAGDVDFDVALDAMVRATRRFAKRQRTWFRAESAVVWRHPGDDARIVAEVAAFLDVASLQKH